MCGQELENSKDTIIAMAKDFESRVANEMREKDINYNKQCYELESLSARLTESLTSQQSIQQQFENLTLSSEKLFNEKRLGAVRFSGFSRMSRKSSQDRDQGFKMSGPALAFH